jgi:hypothetical protein
MMVVVPSVSQYERPHEGIVGAVVFGVEVSVALHVTEVIECYL